MVVAWMCVYLGRHIALLSFEEIISMNLLNRYIRKQVIFSTLAVLLVMLGIESFMEFISQLSDLGVKNYGILKVLLYVPAQLPADLYQLFPMAGFLGSLIGLGNLASNSELVVMRSSGVSILQIAWSVIKASLWMILFVTCLGEWVAPHLQANADLMKNTALGRADRLGAAHGIWLRQGNTFLYVESASSATQIQKISLFQFNAENQLVKSTFATSGFLEKKHWVLNDVYETDLDHHPLLSKHFASQVLKMEIKPKLMMQAKQDVDENTLWQLLKNILYRKANGLLTSAYEFSFWQRMLKPITSIVMICLGIPFVFGALRSQSNGSRVLVGALLGFVFYMLNIFFGRITLVYQLPPLLSAAFPTVFFSVVCAALLWRIKN
jgi:lipopolysaccharide export system permease protein